MQWQKFKDLNYLVEQNENSDTCLILFHGYGADANDLASLAQMYRFKKPVDWYFPQGPLEVPIGPMMSGRAWFELRISDFESVAGGQVPDIPIRPEEEATMNKVVDWLNHVGKQYKNVIFGGFSQGAILSSHSFYRLNYSPKGMVLLSGFMISPSSFPTLPEELKIPFFQSHGKRDQVLLIPGAKKLFDHLQSLGMAGTWREFNGAHEIPMNIIAESQIFLNSLLDFEE